MLNGNGLDFFFFFLRSSNTLHVWFVSTLYLVVEHEGQLKTRIIEQIKKGTETSVYL